MRQDEFSDRCDGRRHHALRQPRFARVLSGVESGKEFVAARKAGPVARIVPERLPALKRWCPGPPNFELLAAGVG
jgi:antitoxin (DNA-binding transcriptional repressor) of toxin-antitoxin stability system